jgi:putative intracellular protease/amidase
VLTFELGQRRPREETLIAIRRAFRKAAGPTADLCAISAAAA